MLSPKSVASRQSLLRKLSSTNFPIRLVLPAGYCGDAETIFWPLSLFEKMKDVGQDCAGFRDITVPKHGQIDVYDVDRIYPRDN